MSKRRGALELVPFFLPAGLFPARLGAPFTAVIYKSGKVFSERKPPAIEDSEGFGFEPAGRWEPVDGKRHKGMCALPSAAASSASAEQSFTDKQPDRSSRKSATKAATQLALVSLSCCGGVLLRPRNGKRANGGKLPLADCGFREPLRGGKELLLLAACGFRDLCKEPQGKSQRKSAAPFLRRPASCFQRAWARRSLKYDTNRGLRPCKNERHQRRRFRLRACRHRNDSRELPIRSRCGRVYD